MTRDREYAVVEVGNHQQSAQGIIYRDLNDPANIWRVYVDPAIALPNVKDIVKMLNEDVDEA